MLVAQDILQEALQAYRDCLAISGRLAKAESARLKRTETWR